MPESLWRGSMLLTSSAAKDYRLKDKREAGVLPQPNQTEGIALARPQRTGKIYRGWINFTSTIPRRRAKPRELPKLTMIDRNDLLAIGSAIKAEASILITGTGKFWLWRKNSKGCKF